MHIHGNAAAVVRNGYRLIGMNRHSNHAAVPGQGFVNRIIDDLENHVVQARAIVSVTDVHAGAFTNGLKAL
jgi:hypothetical protein